MKFRRGSAELELFAFQHAGVEPDVMVLAKGLGGGIPLGALVAHKDACCFAYGDQGGTFNGNAFATAVGCAVLEEIAKPGFLAGVVEAGAHLRSEEHTSELQSLRHLVCRLLL